MSDLKNILSETRCLTHEQMLAYLESRLNKDEVFQIEHHLADCMFCSDALEGLQSISSSDVKNQITALDNHFEKLLFPDQIDVNQPNDNKPIMQAQQNKRGGIISWRAAAGLFLLIFASGLLVFSYINQNTNWFQKAPNEIVKEDNIPSETTTDNLSDNELESISIGEDEIASLSTDEKKKIDEPMNTPKTIARNSSVKNLPIKEEETYARAERISSSNQSAPAPIAKGQSQAERADNSSSFDQAEKETLAKAVIEKDYDNINAGARNTYSQPLYEGKLKESKKIETTATIAKQSTKSAQKDYTTNSVEKITTGNAPTQYEQGLSAYQAGDYKECIKYLKRALRKNNFDKRNEAKYYLALSYEKTNEIDKASKIYEELATTPEYENQAKSKLKEILTK